MGDYWVVLGARLRWGEYLWGWAALGIEGGNGFILGYNIVMFWKI